MFEQVEVQEKLNALRMFIAAKSPDTRYEKFDSVAALSLSNYLLKKLRSQMSEKDLQIWQDLAKKHNFHTYLKVLARQEIPSNFERDELEVELQLLAHETGHHIRIYRNDRSGLFQFQIRKMGVSSIS